MSSALRSLSDSARARARKLTEIGDAAARVAATIARRARGVLRRPKSGQ